MKAVKNATELAGMRDAHVSISYLLRIILIFDISIIVIIYMHCISSGVKINMCLKMFGRNKSERKINNEK